jgi:tetratricopeptide (TPR) repeat protein
MGSQNFRDIVISAVIFAVGVFSIYALTSKLEQIRPPLPKGYEDSDLTVEGGRLRGYSFGAEGLVADWYWMRALQYLGTKMVEAKTGPGVDLKPLNPRLLYPMLDNASTLDPRFVTVYAYGATVLPEVDPQEAIRLTEKGITNNPEQWKLYHFLGFIYWELKDYPKAAEVYDRGSRLPGAPNWMRMMAVNMQGEGGTRETARQIYGQVYDQAQDEETRNFAKARLLGLESLDEREAINDVLANYAEKNGRCPANWREVFPLIRRVRSKAGKELRFDSSTLAPVDPSDAAYLLVNEGKCEAAVDIHQSKVANLK